MSDARYLRKPGQAERSGKSHDRAPGGGRPEKDPEQRPQETGAPERVRRADALGMVEVNSLPAMISACDEAAKAAQVDIVAIERIGCAMVTCFIRGDVAAVRAAVEAGSRAAEAMQALVAGHVIPRPHPDLEDLFPISGPVPGAEGGVEIDCGC